ncbi:MAG: hypothetical protein HFE59_04005 [Clostridiales bacterium]|nr:hypothetical protein [Clostridiales bacterium]
MNININQSQNSVAMRQMYQRNNNNKTISVVSGKNKSACDGLIENSKKLIEDKKKQIQEVKADDSIPENLKKIKLEILQDQLKELENQLNQAIMEKQKQEAEELVRKQNEKTKEKEENINGDTKTQRFIDTFSKVAFNFNSIQQNRITKAEKERDTVRIELEMENDTKRGIIGDKADELYESALASSKLEYEIEKKTSDINREVKEYREKEIEEAKKAESEKSEEEKTEEKIFGTLSEEEKTADELEKEEKSTEKSPSNEPSSEPVKKEPPLPNIYGGNSFNGYSINESVIDTNC